MRILLATASCLPAYGGPAFLVCRLAEALCRDAVEVAIWAADGSASTTPLLTNDVPISRLGTSAEHALNSAHAFDLIHDHGIWLPHNHRLAKLSSARGIPRVLSIHGMLDPWCLKHKALKKRIAWHLYQRTDLKSAAAHHVTSSVELTNLQRLNLRCPIEVIPLGVEMPSADDINARRKRVSNRPKAVYLGRLHPVKGLPMLLEAWAKVRPREWDLQIAGPDEAGHLQTLRARVHELGLAHTVSFVGPRHGREKREFLLSANLFVLPSHSESFGLAIAEALGHGVPVLATTATPWPILRTENCGWWVDPTEAALVDGLRHATSASDDVRATMGRNGRDWVRQNLQWPRIAEQFLSLYRRVIAASDGSVSTVQRGAN